MSLIIDALKKTQQLRLNGSEGPPLLRYSAPDRTRGRNAKKQWIVIGAGFIGLGILLFVLLRPASSPLAIQTNGAVVSLEKTPFIPVLEKISSELPREMLSLPKDEEPLPTNQAFNPSRLERDSVQAVPQESSNARVALSDRPSAPVRENMTTATKPSLQNQAPNKKKGESVVKQAPPPLAPVTQKVEVPPQSITVEREGEKDHTFASDILNHFNSGVTLYNQKEFSKAIVAYQKVIELDPAYVEAYNNLGIIYQTLGDAKSALGAYQKSTEINPRYEKGYNNLGLLFFLEGRYEEALEVFQKALVINSNNIESHINLGILFKKKGQGEKAIESYQKALAINPLHRETHYNMALLYEQLENWELAINHYQQFIRLSSKSYPELVLRVQRRINALTEAKGTNP
jgi:Tfp pilus assembly protein PilF